MAIPYEYREEVYYWLLNNTGMYTKEAQRFVDNAYKENAVCPNCRRNDNVYVASARSIAESSGTRLFKRLFTYGLSEIIGGSGGKVYLCLNCSNLWH
jgi:hypothetical protein